MLAKFSRYTVYVDTSQIMSIVLEYLCRTPAEWRVAGSAGRGAIEVKLYPSSSGVRHKANL